MDDNLNYKKYDNRIWQMTGGAIVPIVLKFMIHDNSKSHWVISKQYVPTTKPIIDVQKVWNVKPKIWLCYNIFLYDYD